MILLHEVKIEVRILQPWEQAAYALNYMYPEYTDYFYDGSRLYYGSRGNYLIRLSPTGLTEYTMRYRDTRNYHQIHWRASADSTS